MKIFCDVYYPNNGVIRGVQDCYGLDACFLKGLFGGQLMQAAARNENNQMFPIAIAIVESECKDSWGWFLDILLHKLDIQAKKGGVYL